MHTDDLVRRVLLARTVQLLRKATLLHFQVPYNFNVASVIVQDLIHIVIAVNLIGILVPVSLRLRRQCETFTHRIDLRVMDPIDGCEIKKADSFFLFVIDEPIVRPHCLVRMI